VGGGKAVSGVGGVKKEKVVKWAPVPQGPQGWKKGPTDLNSNHFVSMWVDAKPGKDCGSLWSRSGGSVKG